MRKHMLLLWTIIEDKKKTDKVSQEKIKIT